MQQDPRADEPSVGAAPSADDIIDDLRGLGEDPGITEEMLVEEISIDGMCGVY